MLDVSEDNDSEFVKLSLTHTHIHTRKRRIPEGTKTTRLQTKRNFFYEFVPLISGPMTLITTNLLPPSASSSSPTSTIEETSMDQAFGESASRNLLQQEMNSTSTSFTRKNSSVCGDGVCLKNNHSWFSGQVPEIHHLEHCPRAHALGAARLGQCSWAVLWVMNLWYLP